MIHVFLFCLPLSAAGVILAFNFSLSHFLFYAGIEIVLLTVVDLLLSLVWQFWKHKPILFEDHSDDDHTVPDASKQL